MKKLILKTTAITLASVIVALGLFFGSFAIFSPITLAKFFDGVGMYSLSINFYESNFDKSNKLSDLVLLINEIDKEKDSELAEQYLKLLVEYEGFDRFCELEDEYNPSQISARDFYLGEYVYALVKNAKFDLALDIAFGYVAENGYTENNPCRIIVFNAERLLDDDQIYKLKQKIYDCRTGLADSNDTRANMDAELLSQISE